MKVLLLHNRYRQRGGEDIVVEAEARLMRQAGMEVIQPGFSNGQAGEWRAAAAVNLAIASAWSVNSYEVVRRLCEKHCPDIAHVHNFWLKLSPSVHAACRDAGVPAVQTIHNYRLFCVNGLMVREGKVCQRCLGKTPWRGVTSRCYRDSFWASAAAARMIVSNRFRRTWTEYVNAFIALSEHSRSMLAKAGLPSDRILVKPNFVEDPGEPASSPSDSHSAVYAGRLSPEKGVDVLLKAWARSEVCRYRRLLVIGDGPERSNLERLASRLRLHSPSVVFTGELPTQQAQGQLSRCRVVVSPSIALETFGRTAVEAFSHGRPVIVSNHGALAEHIQDKRTGMKCTPGDPASLGRALDLLLSKPRLADVLGENARLEYQAHYTPERNLERLLEVYRFAIGQAGKKEPQTFAAVKTLRAGASAYE